MQNPPNFDDIQIDENVPGDVVPAQVPLRQIRGQDPVYAFLQDVVESMRYEISRRGIDPNPSDAESESLDSRNDEELQNLLDEEIEHAELRDSKWLATVHFEMLYKNRKGE